MTQFSHRLMIFTGSVNYSILGYDDLVSVYETWLQLACEPAEKKFEVRGCEDGSGFRQIRMALLWEDVKAMQIENL